MRACVCEFHCYFPGSMDGNTVRVYDFLKVFTVNPKITRPSKVLAFCYFSVCHFPGYLRPNLFHRVSFFKLIKCFCFLKTH